MIKQDLTLMITLRKYIKVKLNVSKEIKIMLENL